MKKLFTLKGLFAIAVFVLAVVLILAIDPTQSEDASIANMASSSTYYSYYYDFFSIKPTYSYKDVWTSSYTNDLDEYCGSYKYVDSWIGPSKMTRTEKVTSGTSRTTSFSGSASYKSYVTATIGYSYTSSSSKEVSKSFEFPGDNKLHTLYVTRRHIDRSNYTWRTSYRATPVSYTYIWGVAYWDCVWGTYYRYSSRDVAKYKSAATTEYQYGNLMT